MSLSDSRRFVFPATAGAVALSTEIACANSAGAATGSQKGTRHFGRVRGAEKNRALSVNLDFVCPNSRRRETPNSGVIRGYILLMAILPGRNNENS